MKTPKQTIVLTSTDSHNAATWVLGTVNDIGGMPAMQMYFPGMEVLFEDSDLLGVGCFTNNFAIARKLVLDPREPAATAGEIAKGRRLLQYLPVAMHVEPNRDDVGILAEGMTPGCILVSLCSHLMPVIL